MNNDNVDEFFIEEVNRHMQLSLEIIELEAKKREKLVAFTHLTAKNVCFRHLKSSNQIPSCKEAITHHIDLNNLGERNKWVSEEFDSLPPAVQEKYCRLAFIYSRPSGIIQDANARNRVKQKIVARMKLLSSRLETETNCISLFAFVDLNNSNQHGFHSSERVQHILKKLVREDALLDTMLGARYINVPQPKKTLSQQYREVINELISNEEHLTGWKRMQWKDYAQKRCDFEIIGFPESLESINPGDLTQEQIQNVIQCKANLKVVERTDRMNWSSYPPPPTPHLDETLPLSNSVEVIPQDPVIGGTNATLDLQDLSYPIESYPIEAEPQPTQGNITAAEKTFMYALGKEVVENTATKPGARVFFEVFMARVRGNDSNNSVPDTLTHWSDARIKNFFNNHRNKF